MKRPINYLETTKNRLAEVNLKIQRLNLRISRAPDGYLVHNKEGRYYWRTKNGKSEYLGRDKGNIIIALTQKKYDIQALKGALKEQEILTKTLNDLNLIPKITFPKNYEYVDGSDEAFIQDWCDRDNWEFQRWAIKDSQNYTLKGEHVRSKSEVIIADRLNSRGIPYHYEACLPLVVEDGMTDVKPDFTILNTRTMETWYWEHFGLTDDEKYRTSMKIKMESYAYNKIFPGKNLIITFEAKDYQLNSNYVNQLIDEYLK